MNRIAACIPVFSFAVVCISAQASAQSFPTVDISAGYQSLHSSVAGPPSSTLPPAFRDADRDSMPRGWYADVTGHVTSMIGIAVQVGGNYGTFEESIGTSYRATNKLQVHEFIGGVRVNERGACTCTRAIPFGHVMAGAINGNARIRTTAAFPGTVPTTNNAETSSTDFVLELGGGVNVRLSKVVGLRAGADYMRVMGAYSGGVNLFRFSVGPVFGR